MLKVAGGGGGTSGAVVYQGTWNASTNTPTLTSSVGTKGYYYLVSVGGSTNLNGITTWNAGDWAVFDGTAWERVIGGTPSTSFTLGNTVVSLGGTTSAVGNLTLNNPAGNVVPAIPTSSITNSLLQNSTTTLGNATLTLGSTTTSVGNLTLTNLTVSSVASTFPNNFLANSAVNFTYSNGVTGTASVSLGGTNALTLTNIPNSAFANSNITLGNATLTLGGTTTAVGNLTLNNPAGNVVTAIPSASITNTLLQNSATTLGNTSLTLGSTTSSVGNLTLINANISATTNANATFGTSSLPLVPQGYIQILLNGTTVKIPYYAV